MRIIVRKEPKVYPIVLPDVPNDGDTTKGWAIEIDDMEITIEQPLKKQCP